MNNTSSENSTQAWEDRFNKVQTLAEDESRFKRKLQEQYAEQAFRFMVCYCCMVFAVVIGFSLFDVKMGMTLAVFSSSSAAAMGLFGWVLNGLFGVKKKK